MPDTELDKAKLPVHVGIIMDGNGRWAQKRFLPRTAGHKAGVEAARGIIKAASDFGVKYLTLYTFSTENWKRSDQEVAYLMKLISIHMKTERDFYRSNNIRLLHGGDITALSKEVQEDIKTVIEDSKDNTGLNLVLAINYGGRDEIVRAINKLLASGKKKIDEKDFSQFLDNPEVPDADLIIRTGGEERLSNFLMWQTAYSELEFSDILWPDYKREDFKQALLKFQNRNRRFGGVIEENKNE